MQPITVVRDTAEELLAFFETEILPYAKLVVHAIRKVPSLGGKEVWMARYNAVV